MANHNIKKLEELKKEQERLEEAIKTESEKIGNLEYFEKLLIDTQEYRSRNSKNADKSQGIMMKFIFYSQKQVDNIGV